MNIHHLKLPKNVTKRDGSVTEFQYKKITKAIFKSLQTVDMQSEDPTIAETITEQVLTKIDNAPDPVDIEIIQDVVEITLMDMKFYSVAKAYVLYRNKRAKERDELTHVATQMKVVKRNGKEAPLSIKKIEKRITRLSKDLKTDAVYITQKIASGLYDGITTVEIDDYASSMAASLLTDHPDYAFLASKIKVEALHKETSGLIKTTNKLASIGLLNEHYVNVVNTHANTLMEIIDYNRDFAFDYFGITTLMKAYLMKYEGKPIERPQDMWMRVAITVTCKPNVDLKRIKHTYDLLSKRYYTHATPTLFNAGMKLQQMSSCFLLAMESDSIDGIFNTLKDSAMISRLAGGIGLHTSNIRSHGSFIHRTNGHSNGLIPFLKIFNETARAVDQGGGKRKGSFAIYLEPWHGDIEEFLELRKNVGNEETRARDLFYALWIPDLFMKRVEEDGEWTLMSESECPGLSDVYGEEFEKLYTQYEQENRGRKTMKARYLMSKIIDIQIEQGQPFMLYKDSVNRKSNQKNIGIIKSSNLCAEIMEYSSKDETAVCNLASISLPAFVKNNHEYDFEALRKVSYTACENLNTVIDINYYPTEKTRKSNLKHRPLAIGVQGLADVFFKMKLPYDSVKARKLNKQIFETIYYGALQASNALAKKHGSYETFAGSPLSEGKFQWELWGLTDADLQNQSNLWDWKSLRKNIMEYGVYNSLLTSCMPTASTSIILGNTESFQIQSNNIYKRQTLSGEFLVINKYLIQELEKINLWNPKIRDRIVLSNGSIQNIMSIPDYLRNIYKTTWEISQKTVIEMSAERAPFVDQSQSMNLWLEKPTFGKVFAMHMYAWKNGLKTGMYYLRSQPPIMPVKVTVNQHTAPQSPTQIDNEEEECIECSA